MGVSTETAGRRTPQSERVRTGGNERRAPGLSPVFEDTLS
jgi:hypothetical protein